MLLYSWDIWQKSLSYYKTSIGHLALTLVIDEANQDPKDFFNLVIFVVFHLNDKDFKL